MSCLRGEDAFLDACQDNVMAFAKKTADCACLETFSTSQKKTGVPMSHTTSLVGLLQRDPKQHIPK